MGMSPQEIDKKIKEIMNEKKASIQENDEENIDVENFDIDDLIERPRISSIPKINLNIKKFDTTKSYGQNKYTFSFFLYFF